MRHNHHLTVGGSPWCDWLGTTKVLELSRLDPALPCRCGHRSAAEALRAAKVLRPYFKRGSVKVVPGPCPSVGEP